MRRWFNFGVKGVKWPPGNPPGLHRTTSYPSTGIKKQTFAESVSILTVTQI
jgi:hypothetical protein